MLVVHRAIHQQQLVLTTRNSLHRFLAINPGLVSLGRPADTSHTESLLSDDYLRQNVNTLQFFAFNFGFSFFVLICQQNSGIRWGSGAPAAVNLEVCVHRGGCDGARALAKPGGMRAHAF